MQPKLRSCGVAALQVKSNCLSTPMLLVLHTLTFLYWVAYVIVDVAIGELRCRTSGHSLNSSRHWSSSSNGGGGTTSTTTTTLYGVILPDVADQQKQLCRSAALHAMCRISKHM
jgi:hypothetical protein